MVDLVSRLNEAKELEVQGRYLDADVLFSSLIQSVQETQDPILATLYNHRGIDRRMLRRYDDAFVDYKNAFDLSPDNEQKAFACVNIADIFRVRDSDFGSAHASLDEALSYVNNGDLMHAKALYQRGLVWFVQKQYEHSIRSHKRGVEILDKLGEEVIDETREKNIKKSLGQNLQGVAVGYIFSGDINRIEEAYDYSTRSLEIFEELGDQQGIFNSVINLGRIGKIKGDYDGAIEQYNIAWRILEKTNYERGITVLSLHLGEAHLIKQELDKATSYLKRFGEGVIKEEITEHDREIIKDMFNEVMTMYNSYGLRVDQFESVRRYFA